MLLLSVIIYSCNPKPTKFTDCNSCKYVPKESADSLTEQLVEAIENVDYNYSRKPHDTIHINKNIYHQIGTVNDTSLIDFFHKWNQSIKYHSHRDFDKKDVLKNICEVYKHLFSPRDNEKVYYLIQGSIDFRIVDSYFVDLDDCVENNLSCNEEMCTIMDFRPFLGTTRLNKVLYLTSEYKITLDSVLNIEGSLSGSVFNDKRFYLNRFLSWSSDEVFNNYLDYSFYMSYVVFNKNFSSAVVKFSTSRSETETWLIKKRDRRWRLHKKVSFSVV